MNSSELMIFAYPIVAALAMAITGVGALVALGYHRPAPRPSQAAPDSMSAPPEAINPARLVDRVLLSLSEAELDYVAERSAALASRAKARRETTHA